MFIGRQAVDDGLLTPRQLRGRWTARVLQGVYRPAWVPPSHGLRCQAAALVLPATAQITGSSMATLLGVPLRGPQDDVTVVIPEDEVLDRRAGVWVRRATHLTPSVETVDGVPLASRFRMGFDLAAREPFVTGVTHLDAVSAAGLLDLPAFREWLAGRREADVRAVRRASEAADGSAASPPETLVRITLLDAGIEVVPQYSVQLRGRVVARVDFAIPDLKIAIEYDGAWHVLREQLETDRRRLNALTQAGWLVVHVTAAMLRSPDDIVVAVRQAVRRQVDAGLLESGSSGNGRLTAPARA